MRFLSNILGIRSRQDVASDIEKRSFLKGSTYSFISRQEPLAVIAARHRATKMGVFILNALIFTVAVTFLALSRPQGTESEPRGMNDLLKQTNSYSPIFDLLEIPIVTKQMEAGLFDGDVPSIFRQEPSPEVDEAWDFLIQAHTIAVNSSVISAIGKDPTKTARYPVEFGFGPDAHIAQLDVFHQVHCLDMIRRAVYSDYYMKDEPITHQYNVHNSHCVHLLLQNLMCTANVDLITYNWVDGQRLPFPDFNINHQCRDFDTILDWHRKNHVHSEMYKKLWRPDDQVLWPATRDFPGMGVDVTGLRPTDIEIY